MPRYEYKILRIDAKSRHPSCNSTVQSSTIDISLTEALLSKEGRDGWKLKGCYPEPAGGACGGLLLSVCFVFERRIIERKSYYGDDD